MVSRNVSKGPTGPAPVLVCAAPATLAAPAVPKLAPAVAATRPAELVAMKPRRKHEDLLRYFVLFARHDRVPSWNRAGPNIAQGISGANGRDRRATVRAADRRLRECSGSGPGPSRARRGALDVVRVDGDRLAARVGGFERHRLQQPLQHRVQAARADVLRALVHLRARPRRAGARRRRANSRVDALGRQQRACTARRATRRARSGCARSPRPSSASSSTRIGKRPCSSGIRSDGFDRWNAPEAMNSMWSVFTMPYLVRHRAALDQRQQVALHAFARDVGADAFPRACATLSISSMNTMPFCSTLRSAATLDLLLVDQLGRLPLRSAACSASLDLELAALACAGRRCSGTCSAAGCVMSSMPGGAMISTPTGMARTSISISRSSSWPSRSILRNFWRVVGVARRPARGSPKPTVRGARQQRVEHAVLGRVLGAVPHLGLLLLARHLDGDVDQVADDRFDVPADVTDLGELGRLDLDERRVRQRAPGGARSRSCRRRSGRSSGCSWA